VVNRWVRLSLVPWLSAALLPIFATVKKFIESSYSTHSVSSKTEQRGLDDILTYPAIGQILIW